MQFVTRAAMKCDRNLSNGALFLTEMGEGGREGGREGERGGTRMREQKNERTREREMDKIG